MGDITEIKNILGSDKLIIGTERTLKELKKGKIKRVFLSKNTKESVREEIKNLSKIGGAEVSELDIQSDELGTVCKKRFSVSVLSELQ